MLYLQYICRIFFIPAMQTLRRYIVHQRANHYSGWPDECMHLLCKLFLNQLMNHVTWMVAHQATLTYDVGTGFRAMQLSVVLFARCCKYKVKPTHIVFDLHCSAVFENEDKNSDFFGRRSGPLQINCIAKQKCIKE